jgi:hypothetical protein
MRTAFVFFFALAVVMVASSKMSVRAQSGDTTPPTIAIAYPSDGSTVSGAKINVTFSCYDQSGFEKFELYIDGALKQTLLPTARNLYFTWSTRKEVAGLHTLQAKAYDRAGNVGTSPEVNVTLAK